MEESEAMTVYLWPAIFAGLFLSLSATAQTANAKLINWAQPDVGCAEEVIPRRPDRACLDLSQVANPLTDWPQSLSEANLTYWRKNPRPLEYCRAKEVLLREAHHPGAFSAAAIEDEWMISIASDDFAGKVQSVYRASRDNKLPVQVLTGALYQESLFAELGIYVDGGNYSCGIGQINIMEWCRWANSQAAPEKKTLGWPDTQVACDDNPPILLKPFYDIALTHLGGLPEYQLNQTHFAGIKLGDVISGFPPGSADAQALRYQISESFINHCSGVYEGIAAKSHELAVLYAEVVPAGIKSRDRYADGESFHRTCVDQGNQDYYPLNVGWLLAVGAYNAGGRAVDAMAYYNRWSRDDLHTPATFADFAIKDLIESFYGAGTYNTSDGNVDFQRLSGDGTAWPWLTACILQRHIARVVQHVTLPGVSHLVDSLEGSTGCRAGDPPEARRTSSGRKESGGH